VATLLPVVILVLAVNALLVIDPPSTVKPAIGIISKEEDFLSHPDTVRVPFAVTKVQAHLSPRPVSRFVMLALVGG
jgi:hypothetical protein